MKKEIIYTKDYALIVSDEYILSNTYILYDYLYYNKIHFCVSCSEEEIHIKGDLPSLFREDCKKVIAHRPLKDAPILEDVLLLPEFTQEDDVEKMVEETYPTKGWNDWDETIDSITHKQIAFKVGYNKAKETYKYTEADIQKAFIAGEERIINKPNSSELDDFINFIQSLQEPKRPKFFEYETIYRVKSGTIQEHKDGLAGFEYYEPKTITNPKGQTELVGSYIF